MAITPVSPLQVAATELSHQLVKAESELDQGMLQAQEDRTLLRKLLETLRASTQMLLDDKSKPVDLTEFKKAQESQAQVFLNMHEALSGAVLNINLQNEEKMNEIAVQTNAIAQLQIQIANVR